MFFRSAVISIVLLVAGFVDNCEVTPVSIELIAGRWWENDAGRCRRLLA